MKKAQKKTQPYEKFKVPFIIATSIATLSGLLALYLGWLHLDTSSGIWQAIQSLPEKQTDSGLYFVCGILLTYLGVIGLVKLRPHTISFAFGELALIMCGINIFFNKSGHKAIDIILTIVAALYMFCAYPAEQQRKLEQAKQERMGISGSKSNIGRTRKNNIFNLRK